MFGNKVIIRTQNYAVSKEIHTYEDFEPFMDSIDADHSSNLEGKDKYKLPGYPNFSISVYEEPEKEYFRIFTSTTYKKIPREFTEILEGCGAESLTGSSKISLDEKIAKAFEHFLIKKSHKKE